MRRIMNECEMAIKYFERLLENSKRANESGAMQYMYDEQIKMIKIALQALREKTEQESPEPLTLEQIKHGKWRHLGGDEYVCTNCGHVVITEGSWENPGDFYCSVCGTKMDGR